MATILTTSRHRSTGTMDDASTQWAEAIGKVARDADRKAFHALFMHFGPLIKAYAGKLAAGEQHEQLAEELVQETMIKVWQKARAYDAEKAAASTWIFTIARNTRIDLLRKNARHISNRVQPAVDDDGLDVEDIWVASDDGDAFHQLASQRTSEMLHDSLQELPEDQAFILRKAYMEDKSHTEIAQDLELPLGTVKSRIRLALNKLRLTVDR